ncbi:MAG TPA: carboxymuconolactone decarboxylase family protein [Terracidiphilus sp.]|jgi:AhpD family alkylhydroperoxidase|nr:carboxymuconolactone decarboxylase family protein [Terracidiphilus sp.]
MEARMNHPAMLIPDAMQILQSFSALAEKSGLPKPLLELVHLRASQINGCSLCVEMHARNLTRAGESTERASERALERAFAVAAWRDAPYFTDAERAALALTEAVTRLSEREDPVPDSIWNEAVLYYDEKSLAALLLAISVINVWNRLNVATRQVAGEWRKSAEARKWVEEHAGAR